MEHVELVHAHGFHCPQQVLHGVVVPCSVHHQSTVNKHRRIPHFYSHCDLCRTVPCELGEGLQTSHDTPHSLCSESGMRMKDGESVGLVYIVNESCMWVHYRNSQILQWWKVLGDGDSKRHKRMVVL